MVKTDKRQEILSFLLLFLFGGVIVGETVSLATVISVEGTGILGMLFIVNGALLLLLPLFFIKKIDVSDRCQFLAKQLLLTAILLLLYVIILYALKISSSGIRSILTLFAYPISYLSKTLLFLTFWTIANDIYDSDEAKIAFPKIASWGFIGGILGALIARMLLEIADVEMIVALWAIAFLVAYTYSLKLRKKYLYRFIKKEDLENKQDESLLNTIKVLIKVRMIKQLSAVYLFAFIAIFLQDFLFWKKTSILFYTSHSLASFQFTFYMIYSLSTFVGLRFVIPKILSRWGIGKVFVTFPAALSICAAIMLFALSISTNKVTFFILIIVFQFVRYVLFENTFSPIYQMLFAAIPQKQRGKAKTFLEGVIKPVGIILAGCSILIIQKSDTAVLLGILIVSFAMFYVATKIGKTYTGSLLRLPDYMLSSQDKQASKPTNEVVINFIQKVMASQNSDIRCLAVYFLAQMANENAFKMYKEIYKNESSLNVREKIAEMLIQFKYCDIKPMIVKMLEDKNPRIKLYAIRTLNGESFPWKQELFEKINGLFFDSEIQIQKEVSIFLWENRTAGGKEKEKVLNFIEYLVHNLDEEKRSIGIQLLGVLKIEGSLAIIRNALKSSSELIFEKSLAIVLTYSEIDVIDLTRELLDVIDRRKIAITGKVLRELKDKSFQIAMTIACETRNKRLLVEMICTGREIIEIAAINGVLLNASSRTKDKLESWVIQEFENSYFDIYSWVMFRRESKKTKLLKNAIVFEDALREQLERVCLWALDIAVLSDTRGIVRKLRYYFDIKDMVHKNNMVELLESVNEQKMGRYIIPVLRNKSLSQIAKTGKSLFRFKASDNETKIKHFSKSSNRFISICAKYYVGDTTITRETEKKEPISENMSNAIMLKGYRKDENGASLNEKHWKENLMEQFDLFERVILLKETQLFKNVSVEKLMDLASIIAILTYKRGMLISREGELSDQIYIIAKGNLKIVKIKNGIKTILSTIGVGETYGEIGLFNQSPRSASAIADDDCEVWIIQRGALKKVLLELPEIAYNLLEVYSEKLRKTTEEIASLNSKLIKSNRGDL